MTDIQILELEVQNIKQTIKNHDLYYLSEVLPKFRQLQEEFERVWMTDQRFKDLEGAVAKLADEIHFMRTGKRLRRSVDDRTRPMKPFSGPPR